MALSSLAILHGHCPGRPRDGMLQTTRQVITISDRLIPNPLLMASFSLPPETRGKHSDLRCRTKGKEIARRPAARRAYEFPLLENITDVMRRRLPTEPEVFHGVRIDGAVGVPGPRSRLGRGV